MSGEAVEFDDGPGGWPEAIDLVRPLPRPDPRVQLRRREVVMAQERQELLLQPAAAVTGSLRAAREALPYNPAAPAAGIAIKQVGQREPVVQPQVFRLPQPVLDFV